jgi:hypothetical protein
MLKPAAFAAFLAIVVVAADARGGAIYAAFTEDRTSSWLVTIDPETGRSARVGPTGMSVQGLAYDSRNDLLYAVAHPLGEVGVTSGLYRVDRATGALALVADTREPLTGLAYDSRNDVLYGGGGGQRQRGLVRIDRDTGEVTPISAASGTMAALEYIPTTDQLVWTGETPAYFGTVDRSGVRTYLNQDMPQGSVFGMAYDPRTDTLYAADRFLTLYRVDPATGVGTLVRPFEAVGTSGGMAYVPEPGGASFVLACILSAFHCRRARRFN